MKVNLGIWSHLTRLIITLLVLAGLLAVGVWYLPLIQQNERMRKEIFQLHAEIRTESEKAAKLRGAIEALRSDPKAVERLARETLGYAKPGETVIRFEAPTAAARPAQ